MPKTITIQSADEVQRSFQPVGRRALREEEMQPYREAIYHLSDHQPGGVIELDEGETPRLVMMRMHKAGREAGKYLRFQRHGKDQSALRFRLQTPEETARLKARGGELAAARQRRQAERAEVNQDTEREPVAV